MRERNNFPLPATESESGFFSKFLIGITILLALSGTYSLLRDPNHKQKQQVTIQPDGTPAHNREGDMLARLRKAMVDALTFQK